jgi:hypothetical protein
VGSASSLKQQSVGSYVTPLLTHYPDSWIFIMLAH